MISNLLFTFCVSQKIYDYFIEVNTLKVRVIDGSDETVSIKSILTKEDWNEFLNHFKTFYNNETYIEDSFFDRVVSELSQLKSNVVSNITTNNEESGVADVFIKTEFNLPILMYFRQDYDQDGLFRYVEIYTEDEVFSTVLKDKKQMEQRLSELVTLEQCLVA